MSKNTATEDKPKAKAKTTLTRPQLRILAALAKVRGKGLLNRALISERASVALSWVTGFTFRACAANTTPSLVEQGLARAVDVDLDGRKEICAAITAAGRKALESANKNGE